MVFKLRLDLRRFRPRRFAADSPTLNRTKRRIEMFSPSLAIACSIISRICHALVLDVVLFVEAIFLVELLHLPVAIFSTTGSGFALASACAL